MKKYFILPLLLVLAAGLSAPLAFAQTTGTVKGTCKDSDGKPIAGAEVEWTGTESGHTYKLKTNNKGESSTTSSSAKTARNFSTSLTSR